MKILLALLISLPALAAARAPDRPRLPLEWGYHPAEGATVALNPPSFTWVREADAASYTLQWSRSADFYALSLRQWDGYDPPPGSGNAANVAREFPDQWHVEAATGAPAVKAFVVAVLRPYRKGQAVTGPVRRESSRLVIPTARGEVKVAFHAAGNFAVVETPTRTWTLK